MRFDSTGDDSVSVGGTGPGCVTFRVNGTIFMGLNSDGSALDFIRVVLVGWYILEGYC